MRRCRTALPKANLKVTPIEPEPARVREHAHVGKSETGVGHPSCLLLLLLWLTRRESRTGFCVVHYTGRNVGVRTLVHSLVYTLSCRLR